MPSTYKELTDIGSDDDFDPTETRSRHTRPAPLPAPAQALPHSRRRWRIQRIVGGLAPPASMERSLNISRLDLTGQFTSVEDEEEVDWSRMSVCDKVSECPASVPSKFYKTRMCRKMRASGFCRYGASCCYAHNIKELRKPRPDGIDRSGRHQREASRFGDGDPSKVEAAPRVDNLSNFIKQTDRQDQQKSKSVHLKVDNPSEEEDMKSRVENLIKKKKSSIIKMLKKLSDDENGPRCICQRKPVRIACSSPSCAYSFRGRVAAVCALHPHSKFLMDHAAECPSCGGDLVEEIAILSTALQSVDVNVQKMKISY